LQKYEKSCISAKKSVLLRPICEKKSKFAYKYWYLLTNLFKV